MKVTDSRSGLRVRLPKVYPGDFGESGDFYQTSPPENSFPLVRVAPLRIDLFFTVFARCLTFLLFSRLGSRRKLVPNRYLTLANVFGSPKTCKHRHVIGPAGRH